MDGGSQNCLVMKDGEMDGMRDGIKWTEMKNGTERWEWNGKVIWDGKMDGNGKGRRMEDGKWTEVVRIVL
jgi:hypothetical protein